MNKKKKRKPKNSSPTLDLHGFTVQEAEEALLQFLSDSVLAGHQRIEVVHGHGTGKVKGAVGRVLGSSDVVKRFEVNPRNAGATVVYL